MTGGQACSPVHASSLTLTPHPHQEEAERKGATTGPGGEDGYNSCLSLSRRPSRLALPSRHPTHSPSAHACTRPHPPTCPTGCVHPPHHIGSICIASPPH